MRAAKQTRLKPKETLIGRNKKIEKRGKPRKIAVPVATPTYVEERNPSPFMKGNGEVFMGFILPEVGCVFDTIDTLQISEPTFSDIKTFNSINLIAFYQETF